MAYDSPQDAVATLPCTFATFAVSVHHTDTERQKVQSGELRLADRGKKSIFLQLVLLTSKHRDMERCVWELEMENNSLSWSYDIQASE